MGKIRKQSYSSISLFKNCPYQYKLKYIDECYSETNSLSLELGVLLHYIMETKMRPMITGSAPIDENKLLDILENGGISDDGEVLGLQKLKAKYFEDYIKTGNKSGLTYQQKIDIFLKNKINENTDNGIYNTENEWNVLAVELPFEIQYNKNITFCGKIDRVDINKNGELRVIDYKSSDASYDDKTLQDALQMYVYSLAIEKMFDKTPIEYIYDFILLGTSCKALTKTNYKSLMKKKLEKLVASLEENYDTQEFKPKPSPLCYWCPYSNNTSVNDKTNNGKCEFYSLWTPTDRKNFSVNKTWDIQNIPPTNTKTQKVNITNDFVW